MELVCKRSRVYYIGDHLVVRTDILEHWYDNGFGYGYKFSTMDGLVFVYEMPNYYYELSDD